MDDFKKFFTTISGKVISVLIILGAVVFIGTHSFFLKHKPVDQPKTADVQSSTTSTMASTTTSNSLKIGDTGYASISTPISSTEAVENKIMQFVAQNDTQGLKEFRQMILSGASSLVEVGTQVKVTGIDSTLYEVKITSGKFSGQSGWMSSDFITATAPIVPVQPTTKTKNTITTSPSKKIPVVSTAQSLAYCSTLSDCAGFKIRLNFKEDPTTCAKNGTCRYHDYGGENEYVYYLTIRGDTLQGEVRSKNLNSGSEKSYHYLFGNYNTQTGKLYFWYGWYTYSNIMEDWIEMEETGNISNNQFTEADGTHADVAYLAITPSDKIPKQGCLIKGDSGNVSGNNPIYYLPTSISYNKVTGARDWFCTESDALNAGYKKALQ